jgi:hypothetical protein
MYAVAAQPNDSGLEGDASRSNQMWYLVRQSGVGFAQGVVGFRQAKAGEVAHDNSSSRWATFRLTRRGTQPGNKEVWSTGFRPPTWG